MRGRGCGTPGTAEIGRSARLISPLHTPPIPYRSAVELGAVIGKTGRDIPAADAMSYVAGYALAIDMTARNMQEKVKKAGLPWSAAKGFDSFTPISAFLPLSEVKDPHNVRLWLKTNGKIRQDGNTKDMIFQLPRLIEHVSSIMTVEEGDLILTGEQRLYSTPACTA